MTKEQNPPAFPVISGGQLASGMTLRDWFAGQILSECYQRDYGNDWGKAGTKHAKYVASEAYDIADAMLEKRNETTN